MLHNPHKQAIRLSICLDLYYPRKNDIGRYYGSIEETVAKAVEDKYPQLALNIWRAIADNLIAQSKVNSYRQAASYLRLMQKTYTKMDRLDEWQHLLDELRKTHEPKRRLMEILDSLSGMKLVT